MRKLTGIEIAKLASRRNVRKIAVENFLMSTPERLTFQQAIENLRIDSGAYNWSDATRDAIYEGLCDMYA